MELDASSSCHRPVVEFPSRGVRDQATEVIKEGAQSTSRAVRRTVEAGAARAEETLEVAADEVQKVVRGAGSAMLAIGAAAASLTVLYCLPFGAVSRFGRSTRQTRRKFIWPSPFADLGARERRRGGSWSALARAAASREGQISDPQFASIEETARKMLQATANFSPECGAQRALLKAPECLGPPNPAFDHQGRVAREEFRWGPGFREDIGEPFWRAQE